MAKPFLYLRGKSVIAATRSTTYAERLNLRFKKKRLEAARLKKYPDDSLPSGEFAPILSGSPVIAGTAIDGMLLTAVPTSVNANPASTRTWQWYRNGSPIAGATNIVYTIQLADVGSNITVEQIETNTVNSVQQIVKQMSAPTTTVAGLQIVLTNVAYNGTDTISMTVNRTGIIYWMITSNSTETAVAIINGTGAIDSGSFAANVVGVNNGSIAYPNVTPGNYYLHIVADAASSPAPSLVRSKQYTFPNADTIAPTITAGTPGDDATNVSITANPTVQFSENVQFATTGTIILYDVTGATNFEVFDVATDVGSGPGKVSISGNILTIEPTNDFANSNDYAIRFSGNPIEDLVGNALADVSDSTTYNFTTSSFEPLAITSYSYNGTTKQISFTLNRAATIFWSTTDLPETDAADIIGAVAALDSGSEPAFSGTSNYNWTFPNTIGDKSLNIVARELDQSGVSNTESNVYSFLAPDVTAPTLSSATDTDNGQTASTGSVTTDEDNGTLYSVVTTSTTTPTKAQVKLGQDHTGAAAASSISQAVNAPGAQAVAHSGLTESTQYYTHYMHEDLSNNQSSVISASGFITDSVGGNPELLPDFDIDDGNRWILPAGVTIQNSAAEWRTAPQWGTMYVKENTTDMAPVLGGTTYIVGFTVANYVSGGNYQLGVSWFDNTGTYISTDEAAVNINGNGFFSRNLASSPANAAYASLRTKPWAANYNLDFVSASVKAT